VRVQGFESPLRLYGSPRERLEAALEERSEDRGLTALPDVDGVAADRAHDDRIPHLLQKMGFAAELLQ